MRLQQFLEDRLFGTQKPLGEKYEQNIHAVCIAVNSLAL